MKLQKDFRKEDRQTQKEVSLRERANRSLVRRKKELRAKMILLNSALALIIIMTVLVFKVVSLNRQGKNALEVSDKVSTQTNASGKKNDSKQDDTEKTEATAAPATPAPSGAECWIRKDLDSDKPMVALTFDDGPYTPVTKRILATLEKNNAKATFFCVGNRISKYSSVVKQAFSQGCQLASHTYEHAVLTKLKKQQIASQVKKTDEAMQNVIGCSTTALRPPGGIVNDKVRNTVKVPMVCWNVDSEDWKSRNKKKILQRCNSIQDGDIVLMHDLYPTTAAAVETLVPRLKKKGYQLVTVDELFYYKGIKAEAGKLYFSGK